MVDTDRLKKRMKELGLTQVAVAERLGISQSVLSLKLNNVRPFYLHEAGKLAMILKLTAEAEMMECFFPKGVHNGQNRRQER